MASDYALDLQEAIAKLNDLYAQQGGIEIEIAKQQRRVAALKALVADAGTVVSLDPNLGGLTETIKSVLQSAFPMPLTVSEIKERLSSLGFSVDDYSNFRGSLHTVLKRLCDSQSVEKVSLERDSPAHHSGMRGDEQPPTEIGYQWSTIIRKELPYIGPGTYVRLKK
jgi:hypothetical protein